MKKNVRLVKLHGKHRNEYSNWLRPTPSKEVPWLNVSGAWLEEAGFNVGDAIEISVGAKELVIKKMKAVV